MCECSATTSESNPRSSNAFASTSGRMLSSVTTVATPSFICCRRCTWATRCVRRRPLIACRSCHQVNAALRRVSKTCSRLRDGDTAPWLCNGPCLHGVSIGHMTDSASQEVDLDLRLVGYFVAVADHRHFGRAAAALRVAQHSLSRQIRRLEQQIGVRLFDRTPQSTRLTEAGEVFLPRAKALLRSAAQATAQAREAAQPSRITLGYMTGAIITPVVRALCREHPDADVQTLHLNWNQPRDALLDHRVDAVVCVLPFSTDQLHVTILYDEPRVVLVPVDHRLAGRTSVTI